MRIFSLLLIILPVATWAQTEIPVDTITKKISYSEIVYVDSATKTELFKKALKWLALNYKSADDVFQMKDEDSGKIIFKGSFIESYVYTSLSGALASIYHTIIISIEDGICKIQMTDLRYKYSTAGIMWRGAYFEGGQQEGDLREFIYSKKDNDYDFMVRCNNHAHSVLSSFEKYMETGTINKRDY